MMRKSSADLNNQAQLLPEVDVECARTAWDIQDSRNPVSGIAVMISIAGPLSTTRIIAPAAYVFAFVSCVFAWVRNIRASHPRQLAAVLAVLEMALLLDEVFKGRWRLHDLLENVAKASNLYAGRAGPQQIALFIVASVVASGIGLALVQFRGRPGASLAACGGILSLSCWCVEVISLHSVDTFLYRSVNRFMVVKLAWAACSLMVGFGILWDTFAAPAHARSGNCL